MGELAAWTMRPKLRDLARRGPCLANLMSALTRRTLMSLSVWTSVARPSASCSRAVVALPSADARHPPHHVCRRFLDGANRDRTGDLLLDDHHSVTTG